MSSGWGAIAGLAVCLGIACSPQEEGAALFRDRTEASGLTCVHDHGGTGEFYFPEIMAPGGALFDYDGDGDLDLYCVQSGPLVVSPGESRPSDRLLRNDLAADAGAPREPSFTDVTEASGIRAAGYGMGAAAGDIDNDGRTDLYVTNFGSNQLWRNLGGGRFEDVTAAAGVDDPRWSTSAAFLDYDRDGWLDLFVTNYVDFRVASHQACTASSGRRDYCAPGAYRGEPDRLFRNRGDGTFEDVSGRAGILSRYGAGLGVVTVDFDGDGFTDIFVANDQEANFLWMNRGDGSFEEGALLAGVSVNMEGQTESSMGVTAGDVDEDGDEDLFMTHLNGETNTLYVNQGDATFYDRTFASALGLVSLPFTGFGTAFLDFDGDGRLDLFAANGAVHTLEARAREGDSFPFEQRDQLFRNLGNGAFEDATRAGGTALEVEGVSRGAAVGDLNDDGAADLVVFNTGGPARLLLGRAPSRSGPGSWLGLRLLVGRPGRDALGARVELELADGRRRWRRVRSDASYLSANDPRVRIRLAPGDSIAVLRVRWPGGRVEEWTDLPERSYATLVEGSGAAPKDAP